TITAAEEVRDTSAQARIEYLKIGLQMWSRRPWGVGAGNFPQFAGGYDHRRAGRDAHSTYVRCFTELGTQGFILFMVVVGSALLMLYRMRHDLRGLSEEQQRDVMLLSVGLMCSLAVVMGVGLTHTLLYTEFTWWFLMLPVCLWRAMDNTRGVVMPRDRPVGAMFQG
ncbi:MAG: hypothetical protein RBS80_31775, partial [Thermoguttaceae bacterium]|nr:hypothetical protein [Thermoguttaceae bacterium]